MSNHPVGQNLRGTLGMSPVAPATVTTSSVPFNSFITATDGTGGNDVIIIDPTVSYVFGNAGNDILDASQQLTAAVLIGGTGDDIFKFKALNVAGTLSGNILDFDAGDKIDLFAAGITSFDELIIDVNENGSFASIKNAGETINLAVSSAFTTGFSLNSLNSSYFTFASDSEVPAPVLASDGPDLLQGSDVGDLLQGLGGDDSMSGFGGNDTLQGGDGNDFINGNAGVDSLSGGNDNDTVRGGQNNDTLNGNAGNDTVNGNKGNDLSKGGQGNDTVKGGQDDDIANGNKGDDVVNGDLGNDNVKGGQGNDTLNGGDGNDTLNGNLGNDDLNGGNGADIFAFSENFGDDIIADFTSGVDVIQFASTIFNSLSQILGNIEYIFGDAVIDIGDGNSVGIIGVAENSLSTIDFSIGS